MKGLISEIVAAVNTELKIKRECTLSPFNTKREPSLKMLKNEEYDKSSVIINGIPMNIENPQLSMRRGKDDSGKEWSSLMTFHYGEFTDTLGADGDPIDVFLGPECYNRDVKIFIVNQYLDGIFDEHKVMFGFANKYIAKEAYLEQYDDGWKGFHSIKSFRINGFKKWLNGDTTIPA